LLAACALRRERRVLALAFAVSAALAKEDVPVVLLCAALPLWCEGDRRGARAVVAVSLAVLTLNAIVMRACGGPLATDRFHWLMTATPRALLEQLTAPHAMRLPIAVLATGGLLAGRGARWLAPAVPVVGLCMLDRTGYMTRLAGTYYLPVVVAAVLVAIVEGARADGRARRVVVLAALALPLAVLASPLPTALRVRPTPQLVDDVRALGALVPPGRRVCAQNNVGPQLDPRRAVVALSRCRADDALIVVLASTAPPDTGLILRHDTATLLGLPLRAFFDAIHRAVQMPGATVVRRGSAWLIAPPGCVIAGQKVVDDDVMAALAADARALVAALGARYVERGPLTSALIELAVGGPERWR
jgi:hypothetical protein